MMLRLTFVFGLAVSSVACKQTDLTARSASVGDAVSGSEQCGVVQKNGEEFALLDKNGSLRALQPEDGSTLNVLSDVAARKEFVCIRGDWSGADPVSVVSTTAIRKPVVKTVVTEECGVLMMSPAGKIVLQIAGNNSENNVDRELDPQDGATENLLKQYAASLTEVCVKGDFSASASAVMIKSQSAIRRPK
ncbi:MAG: hypothetical protein RLZZ488_2467 [Pseudomonadota bacterium]|jgi:hypothetical protein